MQYASGKSEDIQNQGSSDKKLNLRTDTLLCGRHYFTLRSPEAHAIGEVYDLDQINKDFGPMHCFFYVRKVNGSLSQLPRPGEDLLLESPAKLARLVTGFDLTSPRWECPANEALLDKLKNLASAGIYREVADDKFEITPAAREEYDNICKAQQRAIREQQEQRLRAVAKASIPAPKTSKIKLSSRVNNLSLASSLEDLDFELREWKEEQQHVRKQCEETVRRITHSDSSFELEFAFWELSEELHRQIIDEELRTLIKVEPWRESFTANEQISKERRAEIHDLIKTWLANLNDSERLDLLRAFVARQCQDAANLPGPSRIIQSMRGLRRDR